MQNQATVNKRELLSNSVLFSQLEPAELDKLVRFARIKHAKPKEVIFNKGDLGHQLFAILNGRVQINTLSDQGKEMTLIILEGGDIFGDISVFDSRERTATATALEASELLVIEKRDFIPFLKKNPAIAIKIIAALCERLRNTDEIMEDVVFRNLPARLAKKLLALADTYGEDTDEGLKIKLKLSQTELGNMVSTSRESINKQIRAWEDKGIIQFDRGYITICQQEQLEDIVYCD